MRPDKVHLLGILLLIATLVVAAGLRFYNLNWDNGIFAHPDERSTVAFYAPTIRWPEDSSTLLDPRTSTLNPFWDVRNQSRRSYTYGHFPLYSLVLTANLFYELTPYVEWLGLPQSWIDFFNNARSGHGFARIGRGLMALADLFTVYLLFLIGRRLYGFWGGLLAAALSAFTVLQIQLAHFFAVDPISTTFTVLAIYGSILLYDRRTIAAAVITGLGIGLAVASKFSALPIAVAPVVAAALVFLNGRFTTDAAKKEADSGQRSHVFVLVVLSLGLSFLIFTITSPFVLLDFENFRQAVLTEQGNMVSGVADFPFTRQYRNTPAYWYFIEQQLRWGMGWPLGLLALAGTIWVIGKALIGRAKPGELIALSWVVLYFGPTGIFLAKFMRYMVPVVPFLTLFGAGLIIALWKLGDRRATAPAYPAQPWATSEAADRETSAGIQPNRPSPKSARSPIQLLLQRAAVTLAVIVVAGTAFWSLAFVNGVYGTEHPWVTFARWTYNNVPDGSCIAWEHWDDRMPTDIPEPGGNPGFHNYHQPQLPMYDDDSRQKYELLRDTLMDCDYVVLATNRLSRTIPRLPERYPMSARYYEALFSGALGFEPVYSVETPPRLAGVVIDDQPADESFTVYDHPKPILFKKTRQLSETEWDAVLGNTWQGAIPGYVGGKTLSMWLRGAADPPQAAIGSEPEPGKSLLLDTPVDQLTPVNDFRWNGLANRSTLAAVVIWWLLASLIGLLTFPLTFLLFHNLPDRGYALSKSFGILLIGYFVWINSSLGWLNNTFFTAALAVVLLVGVNVGLALKHHQPLNEFWRDNWQRQRLPIIGAELVFGVVYGFFIYLRVLNPDLWQPWLGGEKMLEIGFLNAVVKSAEMPPYDPFFANGVINYYYYGLFLAGVLIKLTGIQPSIAFNLAVPLLAGLTATSLFSLAGNLAAANLPFTRLKSKGEVETGQTASSWGLRSLLAGLIGVLFVVFIGNLEGAFQFMRNLGQVSASTFDSVIPGLDTIVLAASGLLTLSANEGAIATYNYWDPTRVIPETINEFPYFSFLFADLHPHMIGIPFTILVLSLAYNWIRPGESNSPFTIHHSLFTINSLLRWLALPFVLGAVGVINTWDLPTYLGIILAAFLIGQYRQLSGRLTLPQGIGLLLKGAGFAVALAATTYLLYAPFFANYQPPAETGLGFVRAKTPLDQHLKIWGFFIFIISSWLIISLLYPASRHALLRVISLGLRRWNVWPHFSRLYERLVKPQTESYYLGLWSIVAAGLLWLVLIGLGYTVPAYLLPLMLVALLLLFRREVPVETAYVGLLVFTGLLVLFGVEFFFLEDFLGGGDYYRMNTLFKFFIQVWIMFGVAAAVILAQVWGYSQRWPLPGQVLWQGAALLLLLATLTYPVFATRTRIDDRFPGDDNRPAIGTLDGLAYMTVGRFEWPAGSPIDLQYDYEAIRWMQDNVSGTPVIAEAKVGYYREGGMRVAAYTGLPSILGGLHQNEQRYASQIGERDLLVNEFWSTTDPNRTLQLLDQLNISYIYIGQIERITYGQQIGDKFEQLKNQGLLELVFENEKTKIYRYGA